MIINILQSLLETYTNKPITIDYAENETGAYGLYNTGVTVIKEFIDGRVEKQANFTLYIHSDSVSDADRLYNLSQLNAIADYIQAVKNYDITDENNNIAGIIKKFTCSNGMLFAVPENVNNGYTYQLQIKCNYILN